MYIDNNAVLLLSCSRQSHGSCVDTIRLSSTKYISIDKRWTKENMYSAVVGWWVYHDNIICDIYLCLDINWCRSNPCQNGGTCMFDVNGYTCSCTTDYLGTNCQTGQTFDVTVGRGRTTQETLSLVSGELSRCGGLEAQFYHKCYFVWWENNICAWSIGAK